MANPVSKPFFTHSGIPLLANSPLERSENETDFSRLQTPRERAYPSRLLHAVSVDNLDLYDTLAREQIEQLLNIVCERLNLMTQMGQLKFIMGVPPLDESQEARVLGKVIEKAEKLDLPTDFIERFFQAQMDIAKLIQSQIIGQLKTQGLPKPTDKEKQSALEEQRALRTAIEDQMEPLLLALKPLVKNLSSLILQREISRQLDNNTVTGECAKLTIREEIKNSFKIAAGF